MKGVHDLSSERCETVRFLSTYAVQTRQGWLVRKDHASRNPWYTCCGQHRREAKFQRGDGHKRDSCARIGLPTLIREAPLNRNIPYTRIKLGRWKGVTMSQAPHSLFAAQGE